MRVKRGGDTVNNYARPNGTKQGFAYGGTASIVT